MGKDTGNERAERGKSIPGVRDQHQNVPVVCNSTKQLNPISGNAPIGLRTIFKCCDVATFTDWENIRNALTS
ncbi:hypothetical protein J15TS10_44100 [Paenibacillus woosongensis]|uniref:Uncharacterized protein n=1 Tax=Paenibacillus woosongensis TaxID=307580 RepID=A0ABQ4MXJ0_9BACL|nr:hypothetical protein J15TS10_44100 [Paenibacillus woosongensis]